MCLQHDNRVRLASLLPAAAFAALVSTGSVQAADFTPPPQPRAEVTTQKTAIETYKAPSTGPTEFVFPETSQWRYSEFINAVEAGKVERVRFSKDGSQCQLTAVDGRRALVTLPNDPELVDVLAKNGVDISVAEGEQQGNFASLLGNLLFPLLAFAGLFFLFRGGSQSNEGGGSGGGMGPLGGPGNPLDFGRNKSKFQEVPETGIKFSDVAVRRFSVLMSLLTFALGCRQCQVGTSRGC